MNDFKNYIDDIQDFPETGITFRDISPLLSAKFPEVIKAMSDLFCAEELDNIDAFAGIDARGFIFASALAVATDKNMMMIRKAGKLPPPKITKKYQLEYGSAAIEVRPHHKMSVMIIDDVLATGGSLKAAADLCTEAGHDVKGFTTLIDLKILNDFTWNGMRVKSVLQYHD